MSRTMAVVAAALVIATMVVPGAAEAHQTYVGCWDGKYPQTLNWKIRPKHCVFNGDDAMAFQTPIMNMRWRSWGGKTACGRGTIYGKSQFRAKVRFCLYHRTIGDGYIRIRYVIGKRYCAWFPRIVGGREVGGHYSCGHHRTIARTHYRNWTL